MTFPDIPLPLVVEIKNAGAWTDITPFVYTRDPVRITRGRTEWGEEVERSTAEMTLDNRDGRFSPRHPESPFYGIGRQTPIRISRGHGDRAMYFPGTSGDSCTAPDTAGLSITGDLDVRIDLTTRYWATNDLAGKWEVTGDQRSWALWLTDAGVPTLYWSTDGAVTTSAVATEPIPLQPGRMAVRATLDVDNGSGSAVVTFYTAPTIGGTWTQLGDTVVFSPGTSVFDSTAAVEIANVDDLADFEVSGRIHSFELRDGIDGTLVASPDFGTQSEGTTSFKDSQGNTWTLAGNAIVTNRRFRFHGEVIEWPVEWDKSGNDVYVSIRAAGILHRLGQAQRTLGSAVERGVANEAVPPVAYWPMEDGQQSSNFASGVGGAPLLYSTPQGEPVLADYDGFAASRPLPRVNGASFFSSFPGNVGSDAVEIRWLMFIPENVGDLVLMRLFASGSIANWHVKYYESNDGLFLESFDESGTMVSQDGLGSTGALSSVTSFIDHKLLIDLELSQNGSDIAVAFAYHVPDPFTLVFPLNTSVPGHTLGSVWSVVANPDQVDTDTAFGHIRVYDRTDAVDNLPITYAHAAERALNRVTRLASEEGITARVVGAPGDSVRLGVQTPAPLLDLLHDAAAAEAGMLIEPREVLGIGMRAHRSMYRQDVAVTLDYSASQVHGRLRPVDDYKDLANDVTVSQRGGGSARATQTDGSLATSEVGTYEARYTINAPSSLVLPQHAGWRMRLGTVDEPRYPTVTANLAAPGVTSDADLLEALLLADQGDRLQIVNPPDHLPPETIDQLIQGYTETMGPFTHTIEFNCSPYRPWRVAEYGSDRYGTSGSEISTSVDDSATSIDVGINAGPLWTNDAAHFPFDIMAGGERMTVTGIIGTFSPQTFNVERSVNGIVKPHAVGTAVRLFDQAYRSL